MEDDHPDLPWPLSGSDALREEILAAYAEPHRGHHGTRHLREVLAHLSTLTEHGTPYDRTPVLLAAWFHDAVYDGERDAEERSASWAEESLPGLTDPATVAEVARLVRLTEHHRPEEGDANGAALSDADLAILAAPVERYDTYVAAVRREYAHLPDEVFDKGRAEVLLALSSKPRLFHTAYGVGQWEGAARANLARELTSLTATG